MLLDDPELQRAKVTGANLEDFLGVRKFLPDRLPERIRWAW